MAADGAPREWLPGEFVALLSAAFEMMAGERPGIEVKTDSAAPGGALAWRQPFAGVSGCAWVCAEDEDVSAIGGYLLRSAGLTETDPESIRSTYLETLSQALSGLAQTMSAKLNREVTPDTLQDIGAEPNWESVAPIFWMRAAINLPERAAVLHAGFEQTLLDALDRVKPRDSALQARPQANPAESAGAFTARTFDLLLDVELPVSVSFGRAQVQLKDVLKLTTGSIVELNRSIAEPVEVIVNNCVIARGEVVVIEGNFGVRIQQVISRQERLRTLQ